MLDCAITHTQDIARAHFVALEKGRERERYLLSGPNETNASMAALVNAVTGNRSKAMVPPRWLMSVLATVQEWTAPLTGKEPDITRDQIHDAFGRSLFYDASKARAELGWDPRPAGDTLRDALRWLAWTGQLKGKVAAKIKAENPADPDWPAA